MVNAFPNASELQFLVGKQICQVVLNPNAVQFRWVKGGQITAECDIEHVDESGHTHNYDCAAFTGPPLLLHRLVMKTVVALAVEPARLTLGFSGGQQLRFVARLGAGENGSIMFGDDQADGYIVF